MLNLYLKTSSDKYERQDHYQAEPVNYAFRFADVQDIQAPVGSFSQTMRLPLTTSLQERFGLIDKPGYVPADDENGDTRTVLFKQKYPAALGTNGTPVILGYIQVKGVVTTGPRKDVEVVFFSDGINMTKAVGDKMLSELNLSDYEHELNLLNIQSSWLGTLFTGDVRYGLIDKGFNWSLPDNPPWASDDGLWQGELTPFVRARTLVDQIFEDAGLTYVSDFFDSTDFGNIYLPAYNGKPSPGSLDEQDHTFAGGINGDLVGPKTLRVLPVLDTISGSVDPSNNWTNSPSHIYTAPYTGRFSVRIHSVVNFAGAGSAKLLLYKNGSLLETLLDTTNPGTTVSVTVDRVFDGSGIGTGLNGPAIILENGDTLALYYELSASNVTMYGDLGGTVTPEIGQFFTTTMEVFAVSEPLSGQDIDLSNNMPELKQVDFLLSLQKMFNLVFIPSGVPDEFIVEPWDDYFDTGTQISWNNKVHRDKSMTLRPTTDIQFKEYQWTFREGLDFISDAVEKSLDRVYGAFRVLDSENDFATGNKKIEASLGGYILSLIPGSSFPIHRSLKTDGSAIENPVGMLAYWGGLVTSFGDYYLRNDLGQTTSASNLFPLFSPYSADNPTITDKDLNFGMEAAFVPQQCNPLNTLYYTYWKDYIRELYSEDARTLECTISFDNYDLLQFKWNNKYYIDGAIWRVLELNTDLNGPGTATVKLLKVQDAGVDCADTPTGYDDRNNIILFNNSTGGSPDYGSEACCTKYGYRWVRYVEGDVGKQRCKPRNQQTQPQ